MKMMLYLLVGLSVLAQDSGSAEQEAMMKKWMEIATPGSEHQLLAEMEGEWDVQGKFRMSPMEPWQESISTTKNEMILGGRFLKSEVSGMMMGMPFEGFGLMGYDKGLKTYVYTWGDNFGTMLMSGTGPGDLEKKAIEFVSEFVDPMTDQKTKMRSVYRVVSPDEYVMEMYGYAPDGSEFLSMTLTHKKKK